MPVGAQAFDYKTFHVETFAPVAPFQRLDTIDLSPDQTAFSFSTSRPGGFTSATVGYEEFAARSDGNVVRFGEIPNATFLAPHYALVRMRVHERIVFEGRIVRRDLNSLSGVKSFQAKGLGISATNDAYFTAPSDQTYYSTGDVIRIILGACTNNLIAPGPPDQWVDPQIDHHLLSEFDGRLGSQVIEQLIRAGNGTTWDFNVWNAPEITQPTRQGIATLLPRVAPAVPNYHIPFDSSITQWAELSEEAYNQVLGKYTDAETGQQNQYTNNGQPYTDTTLYDLYGLNRSIVVDFGTVCSRCADAATRTYLAAHRLPSVQCTVSRNGFRGLEVYGGGAEMAPYFVRADAWVKVGNYPQILPVMRTECNGSTGELTLELGSYAPSYGNLIHDLHKGHCAISGGSSLTLGGKA